jgi:hypothetical protein
LTSVVRWWELLIAALPATIAAAFGFWGLIWTLRAQTAQLKDQHDEDHRRYRLGVYRSFLATDRRMVEYIKDQDRGEKWEPTEVHVARFEWHSAMNGLVLIDAPTVREAMENYRDAIVSGLGAINQSRSNRKRWKQMIDVLNSRKVSDLRKQLEDAMRADAGALRGRLEPRLRPSRSSRAESSTSA